MENSLIRPLEAQAYRVRQVSIDHLTDLQEAIAGLHRQGLLDEELYQERLAGFVFEPPSEMPQARSLVVVAYPDPPVRFYFHYGGARFPVVVPPTYLHYQAKDRLAAEILAARLQVDVQRLTPAALPKKLLAVCSGLAEYGKNNIAYVAGLGSYHRLAAFYSDLACEQDEWCAPKMIARCQRCRACERACPTGAIDPGRFLLRAERCLTFWNEKPNGVPFPGWLDPASHNSLEGCMACQQACPVNRGMRDWIEEGGEFTEEETELLLAGVPLADLPPALAQKLERWDLQIFLAELPRNLSALLRTKKKATTDEHSCG